MDMTPATDKDLDNPNLPTIVLTNDAPWEPKVLDNEYNNPDT